jgi:hypothetical protein
MSEIVMTREQAIELAQEFARQHRIPIGAPDTVSFKGAAVSMNGRDTWTIVFEDSTLPGSGGLVLQVIVPTQEVILREN